MARRPRIIIPGVAHHVTQRGNDRQIVFHESNDYRLYLKLLSRNTARFGTQIVGYCLMPNHVHLIAVPEKENSLARTLASTHSEYALAHNRNRGRTGHLWQNRFFSCPMDSRHMMAALCYVDCNPVRASLADSPWDWPWSSARAHVTECTSDPVLDPQWTAGLDPWNFDEWHDILAARAPEAETAALRHATRTGGPLGSREFLATIERRTVHRLLPRPRGARKMVSDPIF